MICYVYTSVSCYAIIYNGYGDSGIQRGRYVWHELCTLFGDYATSTPHHSPRWPRTLVLMWCILREMPSDNFACSCRTASQQTSTLQMVSSRTTWVAALFPSALPLHTQPFQEQGYNVVRMRAEHRTSVRSTSLVTSTLTLQHLVRPEETVGQLCDPAPNFPFITECNHSFYGLFGARDRHFC